MPSFVLRRLLGTYFWRAHTGGLVWWGVPGEGLEGLTSLQATVELSEYRRSQQSDHYVAQSNATLGIRGRRKSSSSSSRVPCSKVPCSKRGTRSAERGTWINLTPGGNGNEGRWRCWKGLTDWPHRGIRGSRPQCRRGHVARNHHGQPWTERLGRAQSPIFEAWKCPPLLPTTPN